MYDDEVLHLVLRARTKGPDRVPPAGSGSTHVIGRSPDCRARVPPPRAPRRHARRRAPRAGTRPRWSTCMRAVPRLHERVRAGAVVAEPRRELERPVPQTSACPCPAASIACCEKPLYARASSTDSRAARGSRSPRAPSPGDVAVAGEPVEPRENARATANALRVAELAPDADRAVDRRERLVEAVHVVGRLGELLEHRSRAPRVEPVGEVGGAAIVGVGLPVGVERGCAACRDERVVGNDVVETRALCVVDDQRRVAAAGHERVDDALVKPRCSRGGRKRGCDRVPGELVAEADVLRVDGEELPPLGLLRRLGQPGQTASSSHAGTGSERPTRARRGAARGGRASQHARARRSSRTAAAPRGREHEELVHVERVAAAAPRTPSRASAPASRLPRARRAASARRSRSGRRGSRRAPRAADAPAAPRRDGSVSTSTPGARRCGGRDGDRVECRIVGPVDVLEHEHGRVRRLLELRDKQGLHLVRRRAVRDRLGKGGRNAAGEVAERAERARHREVVAGAREHAGAGAEVRR